MNTFTSLSTNCCWTALKGKVTEWHKSTCKNLWNKKKMCFTLPFHAKEIQDQRRLHLRKTINWRRKKNSRTFILFYRRYVKLLWKDRQRLMTADTAKIDFSSRVPPHLRSLAPPPFSLIPAFLSCEQNCAAGNIQQCSQWARQQEQ